MITVLWYCIPIPMHHHSIVGKESGEKERERERRSQRQQECFRARDRENRRDVVLCTRRKRMPLGDIGGQCDTHTHTHTDTHTHYSVVGLLYSLRERSLPQKLQEITF